MSQEFVDVGRRNSVPLLLHALKIGFAAYAHVPLVRGIMSVYALVT